MGLADYLEGSASGNSSESFSSSGGNTSLFIADADPMGTMKAKAEQEAIEEVEGADNADGMLAGEGDSDDGKSKTDDAPKAKGVCGPIKNCCTRITSKLPCCKSGDSKMDQGNAEFAMDKKNAKTQSSTCAKVCICCPCGKFNNRKKKIDSRPSPEKMSFVDGFIDLFYKVEFMSEFKIYVCMGICYIILGKIFLSIIGAADTVWHDWLPFDTIPYMDKDVTKLTMWNVQAFIMFITAIAMFYFMGTANINHAQPAAMPFRAKLKYANPLPFILLMQGMNVMVAMPPFAGDMLFFRSSTTYPDTGEPSMTPQNARLTDKFPDALPDCVFFDLMTLTILIPLMEWIYFEMLTTKQLEAVSPGDARGYRKVMLNEARLVHNMKGCDGCRELWGLRDNENSCVTYCPCLCAPCFCCPVNRNREIKTGEEKSDEVHSVYHILDQEKLATAENLELQKEDEFRKKLAKSVKDGDITEEEALKANMTKVIQAKEEATNVDGELHPERLEGPDFESTAMAEGLAVINKVNPLSKKSKEAAKEEGETNSDTSG